MRCTRCAFLRQVCNCPAPAPADAQGEATLHGCVQSCGACATVAARARDAVALAEARGREAGYAAAERDVVAWLRDPIGDDMQSCAYLADCIEGGLHLAGRGEGNGDDE